MCIDRSTANFRITGRGVIGAAAGRPAVIPRRKITTPWPGVRVGRWLAAAVLLGTLITATVGVAAETDAGRLASRLEPFVAVASGNRDRFTLTGTIDFPIDGASQRVEVRLARAGDEAFDLEVTHADYAIRLFRRDDVTALALPKHDAVFVGRGEPDGQDQLSPEGIVTRIIGGGTEVSTYVPMVCQPDASALAAMLTGLLSVRHDPAEDRWHVGDDASFRFYPESDALDWVAGDSRGSWAIDDSAVLASTDEWSGYERATLTREELERQLCRGARRAMEILAPSASLVSPARRDRKVANGELRWIDGHRVVLLRGTPRQIGTAHAELLGPEIERCIDSVLSTFGTVETVRSGKWFPHELEVAHTRLAPHIPADHREETRVLGEQVGVGPRVAELVNVFPELFHCSGFALFGEATVDGKLYHGRVLDYMTTIGLQDAATTFVVAPDGKIPFVNVGYAGFIGSVSGMNAEAISLGEMGGGGEGEWDGVPMATLMRRALEECTTLDDVMALWESSPRTCEYFYVFADGKSNRAVGVAAVPDSIEFIRPGQSHERLGEGIEDAVVLSAGSRLATLRQRVAEKHGSIDADVARWLMSRPVAMESNLHNVLFVPEDRMLYVANADHRRPAAERPYVELDLNRLLDSFLPPKASDVSQTPGVSEALGVSDTSDDVASRLPSIDRGRYNARDTLDVTPDVSGDARRCLDALMWAPSEFAVTCESPPDTGSDALVRFPSPAPIGNAVNDRVAMEWYAARDESGSIAVAPAVVVVHESGSKMKVGRLIAWGLRQHGVHAFLIHLPHYGARRGEAKPTGGVLLAAVRQAVADVRRARDAIAVLPHVEEDRIAIQGTSLGGFVSAVSASLDTKFHGVFLLVAGGNLFELIRNGEKDAAKVRDQLDREGLSGEKLRALTELIEPTRVGHRLDRNRTWLYSGRYDRVVPIENARALAESIGLAADHHVQLPFNHYTGIVYLPVVLQEIATQLRSADTVH